MSATLSRIELGLKDLEGILERTGEVLPPEDQEKLRLLLQAYQTLTGLIEEPGSTIHSLRRLLGVPTRRSEATREVCPPPATAAPPPSATQPPAAPGAKPKPSGHGRNGAEDYLTAHHVGVPHGSLKEGDRCRACQRGKLYRLKNPGVLVRIVGQSPFQPTVYNLEKLRCNACEEIFTAAPPAGVGSDKYDARARALMAVLKYGAGMPFHRTEALMRNLQVPMPASTQWDEVSQLADEIEPTLRELIRQAAQGEVLYNDDTSMRVLSLAKERAQAEAKRNQRTGIFTTGIVAQLAGHRIALFFTGAQHAGENLADVLAERAAHLGAPVQMCDALDRNLPKDLAVILGNCLAHGRRHFVPLAESFPDECRHVLEQFRLVYQNDAHTRSAGLTPPARLAYHQEHSGPIMEALQAWLEALGKEKKVEPNSRLGGAAQYLLNHWMPLTLFLREPGAPLDNNICERALKKAILHRKNALFYKTQRGADVGDAFMSIIHTCELNAVNALEYLTALQVHATEASQHPATWLPWNFPTGRAPPDS